MKNDELYAIALEIRILGSIVSKFIRQDLEQHLQASGARVGALPYGVMHILRHEEMTLTELSRKMSLEPATLVPVIDALESNGLVKRGQDPRDRRRTPLTLTDSGIELLERVPSVSPDSILVKSLKRMGPEKSRQFIALLRELTVSLTDDEKIVETVGSGIRLQLTRERGRGRKLRLLKMENTAEPRKHLRTTSLKGVIEHES